MAHTPCFYQNERFSAAIDVSKQAPLVKLIHQDILRWSCGFKGD